MCEGWTDEVASNLKASKIITGDIQAVEAKYHRQCQQAIKVNYKLVGTGKDSRNLDALEENRFFQLCFWLKIEEDSDGQYTSEGLRKKLTVFFPKVAPTYCQNICPPKSTIKGTIGMFYHYLLFVLNMMK